MKKRKLRTAVGMLSWWLALGLAGCHSAQQSAPAETTADLARADGMDEARRVAEASLGKQAEVIAHGNLALNGREQVLAVNRVSAGTAASMEGASPTTIFVTRAAVLEKSDGKWSQVLLCDEHLKNQNGYLGGSPKERSAGWRLEYRQDARDGLEMKFTAAEKPDASDGNAKQSSEQKDPAFIVRWNKNAKRYQTFDQSQERFLSEVPSLDIPQSILK